MFPEEEVEGKKSRTHWSFSSVPDEIALNCFSRVSKWEYASLSVVCKSFRSLLASPELYVDRRETDEICFYVALHLPNHPSPRWFSLWVKVKPFPPSEHVVVGRHLLVPISASLPISQSMVAIGSNIYAIGGSTSLSSSVRLFDCRKHTWHDAPNMTVPRRNPMAFVVGRIIYVMGGCSADEEWSEIFNTVTQTWKHLDNPEEKNFAYQIKKHPRIFDLCQWWWVIGKVMYCYTYTGVFMWYDSLLETWRYVKGLDLLVKYWNTSRSCRMIGTVNYGGKIALIYECSAQTGGGSNKEFWCAEVMMERRFGGEMCGRIIWIDLLLTVPKSYDFLTCLAISV